MSWISTHTAVQLSKLPRKRLVELADQGVIRTQRLGDKGWRRYWLQDIEKLVAAPQAVADQVAGDPYHKFLRAAEHVEQAAALVGDEDRAALEGLNSSWGSLILALQSLDRMFKALI